MLRRREREDYIPGQAAEASGRVAEESNQVAEERGAIEKAQIVSNL
jgi:hypothetical protein